MAQPKQTPVKTVAKHKRTQSFSDLARDLELLGVKKEASDMGSAKELCEEKIKELKKNGTLHEVSYLMISQGGTVQTSDV